MRFALIFLVACVENGSRGIGEMCSADADCGDPGVVCSWDNHCRWEDGTQGLGDPCASDADCGEPMACEGPPMGEAPGRCCEVNGLGDWLNQPNDPPDACDAELTES